MNPILGLDRETRRIVVALVAVLAITAAVEGWMGRSLLGPDGRFGWWSGEIGSRENSQRVADPYSFSHIVHGILFFALLRLVAGRTPPRFRWSAALLLEAGWEVLENSAVIIDRYRAATIAVGYVGDSILNSCSDIAMMALGFLFAQRMRVWTSVVAVVALEVLCLLWIRDNLSLNILMLIHPSAAIRAWQAAGRPLP